MYWDNVANRTKGKISICLLGAGALWGAWGLGAYEGGMGARDWGSEALGGLGPAGLEHWGDRTDGHKFSLVL